MDRAIVIVNKAKDASLEYSQGVHGFLEKNGVVASVHHEFSSVIFSIGGFNDETKVVWVILGGDGTMLKAAGRAAMVGAPLLGINLGNVGFLTDVEKENGIESLGKVLEGKFTTEKRFMLDIEFGTGEVVPCYERLALNEVFVGGTGKLKEFSIYVNEQYTDIIRADGVLVCTPTGSTAYNLSAGGPIMMSGDKIMALTPVCPHNLAARPWVINGSDVVRIVLRHSSPVIIDGEVKGMALPGQSVLVRGSKYCANIIKTMPSNVHRTLRKKKIR